MHRASSAVGGFLPDVRQSAPRCELVRQHAPALNPHRYLSVLPNRRPTHCHPCGLCRRLLLQLVAGEEIDHMFGLRLGLSTLASAGLGNAVAVRQTSKGSFRGVLSCCCGCSGCSCCVGCSCYCGCRCVRRTAGCWWMGGGWRV